MAVSVSNETNVEKEANKNNAKVQAPGGRRDSKHFAMIRTDSRKVKDLWVINSVADPRPTLETYKYMMAGEKEAPVDHLYLFDAQAKTGKEMQVSLFKDQNLGPLACG